MKLVVFSDSHGKDNILPMIRMCDGIAVDKFIFLGDRVADIAALLQDDIIYVKGNCDALSTAPELVNVELGGKRVMATHGHRYHVKFSLYPLVREARRLGSDIVFFGHTHAPLCEEHEGILLCNPGALCSGSFAVCTIEQGRASVRHMSIK